MNGFHRISTLVLAGFAVLLHGEMARAGERASVEKHDIGKICLRLATIQEPEVDVKTLEAALGDLEKKARDLLKGATTPFERVLALNRVLLTGRKVTYISNKYWRDSTLAASLLRGRGNCLSTTTLYAVLAQRLGLPVRAVLVPRHAYARWDDGALRINIETTASGKELPDAHYHEQTPWSLAEVKWLGHGESLTDRQFASVLHRYAATHMQQTRKPEKALEMIEEAIRLWPENPGLKLDRLDILYRGLGRHAEAIGGWQTIYRTTPSTEVRTRALMALMGHLQDLSRHEQALGGLRAAYRIAPRYLQSGILSMMAASYRTLRQFNEALVVQELSTILDGEADDYSNLAIFYKNAGKLDDAIRCLKKSLEMNPENWNTRLILAGYLIRAKREEEGWAMFKTVKKPRVNERYYYNNLAWFYGSIGRKKEFLKALDKVLTLSRTPGILDYIKTEVDFDRYRDDPDFKALVERHRKRLLGSGR